MQSFAKQLGPKCHSQLFPRSQRLARGHLLQGPRCWRFCCLQYILVTTSPLLLQLLIWLRSRKQTCTTSRNLYTTLDKSSGQFSQFSADAGTIKLVSKTRSGSAGSCSDDHESLQNDLDESAYNFRYSTRTRESKQLQILPCRKICSLLRSSGNWSWIPAAVGRFRPCPSCSFPVSQDSIIILHSSWLASSFACAPLFI